MTGTKSHGGFLIATERSGDCDAMNANFEEVRGRLMELRIFQREDPSRDLFREALWVSLCRANK